MVFLTLAELHMLFRRAAADATDRSVHKRLAKTGASRSDATWKMTISVGLAATVNGSCRAWFMIPIALVGHNCAVQDHRKRRRRPAIIRMSRSDICASRNLSAW